MSRVQNCRGIRLALLAFTFLIINTIPALGQAGGHTLFGDFKVDETKVEGVVPLSFDVVLYTEGGVLLGGFINPDYLAGGTLAMMLQTRLGDGNSYLPSVWLGADAGIFLTGNAGNTPIAGPTLRWQVGTRIGLHAAARYMVPFQLRGKGESYGGFAPELGVGFIWE